MIYLIISILALQVLHMALALPEAKTPKAKPVQDLDVQVAIASAFCDSGLNVENYALNHNIRTTGKLGEILFHASSYLGKPVETVADLHDLLKGAK